MGNFLKLLILIKLLKLIYQPLIRLVGIGFSLWLVLTMLNDLAKTGLLDLWLYTLIKWGGIFTALAMALKQYKQLARLVSRIRFGSSHDELPYARHKNLMNKTVLRRRKDVIAKKYRGDFEPGKKKN